MAYIYLIRIEAEEEGRNARYCANKSDVASTRHGTSWRVSQLRSAKDNAFPRQHNIGSYSHLALNLIAYCLPRGCINVIFAFRLTKRNKRLKRDLMFIIFFLRSSILWKVSDNRSCPSRASIRSMDNRFSRSSYSSF